MIQDKIKHNSLEKVKISRIDQPEEHIRTQVSDERVNEISKSIEEEGLIEPLEVTKKGDRFEVIIGRMRFLALRNAKGVDKVPVKKVDISGMEKLERQLASNTARAEMNTMDKIEAAGKLSNHLESSDQLENSDGRGPDGVNSLLADKLGVSKNTITKWMKVYNDASKKQKERLREGRTSLTALNENLKESNSTGIVGSEGKQRPSEGGSKPPAVRIRSGITSITESDINSLPDDEESKIIGKFEEELWRVYVELKGHNGAGKFFKEKVGELGGREDGPE